MKIKDIFPGLNIDTPLERELRVESISDDSRFVDKGALFFVVRRKNFDIFSVLKNIEPKVAAFVGDSEYKKELESLIKRKPVILVKDIQKEFFRAVDLFYGFNKSNLKFIGITGTNGKTTTAFLIHHILKEMGEKVSLVGTVKYLIGDESWKADYTTPDFLSLRKIFKKIEDKGSRFVVMEVSSHAIDQERVRGINFSGRVFTNISRDHLDYHKTIENYFNTKKKFFTDNGKAVSIINIEDVYGKKIFKETSSSLSYGIDSNSDFRADNIKLGKDGSRFELSYSGESYLVNTRLRGRYNILNILGAIGVISSLGFPICKIIKGISSFRHVEGRLERVYGDIFVDYAHTPDALDNVLTALRETGYEKIICVFGCGGDRDKGKRQIMGQIASEKADFTLITSDNSRGEDPLEICGQIEKGFIKKNYSIIVDRKNAINEAITLFVRDNFGLNDKSQNGRKTCVLVAGKGHEDLLIIKDKKIPFKDSNVIKELVNSRIKGRASFPIEPWDAAREIS